MGLGVTTRHYQGQAEIEEQARRVWVCVYRTDAFLNGFRPALLSLIDLGDVCVRVIQPEIFLGEFLIALYRFLPTARLLVHIGKQVPELLAGKWIPESFIRTASSQPK